MELWKFLGAVFLFFSYPDNDGLNTGNWEFYGFTTIL
jgi:hypothetical protein